jgi:hypothetical protein
LLKNGAISDKAKKMANSLPQKALLLDPRSSAFWSS